jgi:hypothetical protein
VVCPAAGRSSRLCFQQRDGVDEHRLVGNQLGGLLQLGQGYMGLDAGLDHGTAFQLARRGQRGQLVGRQLRAPRQSDMSMFFQFIDMTPATCSLRQHVTAETADSQAFSKQSHAPIRP